MSLQVIENASEFSSDNGVGTVVIESDCGDFAQAFEELGDKEAKNLAINYAIKRGMSDPRLNGLVSHPYPVNSAGAPLDSLKNEAGNALPNEHPSMQIHRYRVSLPLCRKPF